MSLQKFCENHKTACCVCYCNYYSCGQCEHPEVCTSEGIEANLNNIIRTALEVSEFDYEDELDMEREYGKGELAQGSHEGKGNVGTYEEVLSRDGEDTRTTPNRHKPDRDYKNTNRKHPHKRVRTRTPRQDRKSLPITTAKQPHSPIRVPNEHKLQKNETGHIQKRVDNPKELQTVSLDNTDRTGNGQSQNLHNRHTHRRSTSTVGEGGGVNSDTNNGTGTVAGTSDPNLLPRETPNRQQGSTTTDESDTNTTDTPTSNNYTFIIHDKYIKNTNWKKPNKRAPTFYAFEHPGQIHIVCTSTAANISRTITRIARYFDATSGGITEIHSTIQQIRMLDRFISYCVRYGLRSFHKIGALQKHIGATN